MQVTTMNLHLTNNCNLLCKHCLYSSGSNPIAEIDLQLIKQAIDEFAELTDHKGTVNIYGGEPLLKPEIFDILDYMNERNLNIGMTTNINVGQDVMEKLASAPMSRITIDLDGGRAETHDWLRNQKGHFDHCVKSLRYLKSRGKYISINVVLHKKNLDELEELLELCSEIDVNLVNFYIFTPIGRGREYENIMLESYEWKAAYRKVKEWVARNNPGYAIVWERSYEHESIVSELAENLCEARDFEVFDLRCDGSLYFCGLLLAVDGAPFGNIKDKPLKELLNNRQDYLIREKKGCAALGYLESGDIHNLVDPRKEVDGVIPVCPYDWEILHGSEEIKKKFTHINV